MSAESQRSPCGRSVIIQADDQPVSVVFEMRGETLEVPPWGEVRLILRGPETEVLRIGYGSGGLSIFRDDGLEVEVVDRDGNPIDVGRF